ncbi:MAG: class I SAM-dependent methyltransferase [Flavobacteriales bacterium]|nr:class I SAM-dependent methyltransferase [Flavobacteriales bacterium]
MSLSLAKPSRSALHTKPTDTYFSDLQLYRAISNENDITAVHVADLLRQHTHKRLLDLGCGDCTLTNKVALSLGDRNLRLTAIDIDAHMCEAARRNIDLDGFFSDVSIIAGGISDHLPNIWQNVDIAMMVHVNYFMQDEQFVDLIDSLPRGVHFVFVVDKEDSIFSQLWARTARPYWEHARFANAHIESRADIEVIKSVIQSSIRNPTRFPDPDDRDRLLSFLSYSNIRAASSADRAWILETVNKNAVHDKILVETNCYSIRKH